MKIIKINYKNPDRETIRQVANVIRRGKLAIVPGDAVYTLVADATNAKAIEKVNRVKKRDKRKAFNLGLYCFEDIYLYGEFNPLIHKIQKAFPDEPFTFIVKRKEGRLPDYLNPGYSKLGFRIPFNKVTSTLSSFNRTPVIGTSANISEVPNTYSADELLAYFKSIIGGEAEIDLILDAGKLPKRNPSTVLDISGDEIKIIRRGEIADDGLLSKIKNNGL